MKNGVIVPFPYHPSLRRALLEGIEDKTASYSSNGNTVICDPDELEVELLSRCGSCHIEVKEVLSVMREHNSSVPSVVLVDLI